MTEPMTDELDGQDDDLGALCECGAIHSYTEESANQCDACGRPIE